MGRVLVRLVAALAAVAGVGLVVAPSCTVCLAEPVDVRVNGQLRTFEAGLSATHVPPGTTGACAAKAVSTAPSSSPAAMWGRVAALVLALVAFRLAMRRMDRSAPDLEQQPGIDDWDDEPDTERMGSLLVYNVD